MRKALLLVLICASSAFSQQPAPATVPAEQVSVDSARATAGGATFTAPAGWSITTAKGMLVLQPPEPDTHIAIFESDATDAKAAVAVAWAAYKPQSHALRLATPRPSRNGWEERQVFDYETSPNERAVVQAIASRAGKSWTVVLLDGSEPTFEKRSAPINLFDRESPSEGISARVVCRAQA